MRPTGRPAEETASAREDAACAGVLTWYLHTVDAVAHMVSPHRYQFPLRPGLSRVQSR